MVSRKDIEALKEYASSYGWELRTVANGLYRLYIDGVDTGYQFENKPSQKTEIWRNKMNDLHQRLEWEKENVKLPRWIY